jgi:hypothetical protein
MFTFIFIMMLLLIFIKCLSLLLFSCTNCYLFPVEKRTNLLHALSGELGGPTCFSSRTKATLHWPPAVSVAGKFFLIISCFFLPIYIYIYILIIIIFVIYILFNFNVMHVVSYENELSAG